MSNSIELSNNFNHTWIFDIDGTLCEHNGYLKYGYDIILPGVEEFFKKLPENDYVIITTSRKEEYRQITEMFLKEHHIRYNNIIFNVPKGERIVVNDDKPEGLKTSVAVNLSRNKFDLKVTLLDK